MTDAPTIVEVDCSTGIATERPLTDTELVGLQNQATAFAQQLAAEKEVLDSKAAAAASAADKLAKLGLTEEEIAALRG